MYFQLLAVRFLLVCFAHLIRFSFISLSLGEEEGSEWWTYKEQHKGWKAVWLHLHSCVFVIVIKHHFSPHVIVSSRVCVFVYISVCLELHEHKVRHYWTQEDQVWPGSGDDDDLYVSMRVGGWSSATSESYPQSICAHFPPTLRHPGTEMNVHITGITFSGEALAAERERRTNKKYLTREG